MVERNSGSGSIRALLAERLPRCAIVHDADIARDLAGDIAAPSAYAPAAVIIPRSHDDVVVLVRLACAEGFALAPKGGGWSYTAGYAPQGERTVLVDMTRMGGMVLAEHRGSITVGAGVTWLDVYDHLDARGLRVPSFGPLSGHGATVGGLAAQDGGFFGAASHGAVGEGTVIGARLVDGRGETHDIGLSDRIDGGRAPQPLAGDCGAFGIKTAITLAVSPRPEPVRFMSFAFDSMAAAMSALAQLAGRDGIGEAFVFDAGTHANLAATGFSLGEMAGMAGDLMSARDGLGSRLGALARAAMAGPGLLRALAASLHLSIEGPGANDTVSQIAALAHAADGTALPDTIPRVTRSRPFRPVKALLGPAGERWLPLHGIFPAQSAAAAMDRLEAVLAETAVERARHDVRVTLLASAYKHRVLIEPQLFWPDALTAVHRRMATADQVARYGARQEQSAARELAHDLRRRLITALDSAGAAHFQIGRTYAANPGVDAATIDAWRALKSRFDPAGTMNPGVLGL